MAVNISGIAVAIAPGRSASCVQSLRVLPGVVVHHVEGCRAVVTQETASTAEQEDGLRQIQALPGVVHAELVYHWFKAEAP